jgi:hypothetical protein
MRKHAIKAHDSWFRSKYSQGFLVDIPPEEIAAARSRAKMSSASATRRPVLRQEAEGRPSAAGTLPPVAAAASVVDPGTMAAPAGPAAVGVVGGAAPVPGLPPRVRCVAKSPSRAASSDCLGLDDFDMDWDPLEMLLLPDDEAMEPGPVAPPPLAAESAEADSSTDDAEELPPPLLPALLPLSEVIQYTVAHPDLPPREVSDALLSRAVLCNVSSQQVNVLRLVVNAIVGTERALRAEAVAAANAATLTSNGDMTLALTAALHRLHQTESRPRD